MSEQVRCACVGPDGKFHPHCPVHGDQRAGKQASYVEVRSSACHAGSDGDCDWSECPQQKNYQTSCPLLAVPAPPPVSATLQDIRRGLFPIRKLFEKRKMQTGIELTDSLIKGIEALLRETPDA